MSIFSGNNTKYESVLVFNIGSSSVGGAVIHIQNSGGPKIVFSTKEPVPIEETINIERFLFLTIQSLDVVVNSIAKAGTGAPSRIFCVLSSPWCISQTRVIRLEKNTPFTFTQKLADSLIQNETALFEQEHLTQYLHTDSPVRSIELKNIKTTLNGYETPAPLNQKAKELEMTIFISMSPEQVLRIIESTIRKRFNVKEIKFSSFVMASFATVRDMFAEQEDFLLVDIGGEVTDISMIKKNILRESISFPLGLNFLTRGVASALPCSPSEAQSLISLYKDRHADESAVKRLDPVIKELKIKWLKKFQESLANLSNDISIPATIYIALDKDFADFFSDTIKTEQFNQYTLTESKFQVIFLGTEIFHGHAMFEENTIREPGLIIASIYINRFFK